MWLLEASVKQAIDDAKASGFVPSAHMDGDTPNAHIMKVSKGLAVIHVIGVITNAPDLMARYFGGGNTTYPQIIDALAVADADEEVTEIEVHIGSPGGSLEGLFPTLDAIGGTNKPTTAVVAGTCASAAYALAAACGSIRATNRAARFGSVGIVVETYIDPNKVSIASTNAPKKRPDLSTPAGRADVREELDDMHALFADAIASGRGTTADKVNSDFGQGAMFLAGKALKRGMIDVLDDAQSTTPAGDTMEATMNLKELQAKHPDLHAAVMELGVTEERDRVTAHLTMGDASGDLKTAHAAIESGAGMTATLQAKYLAAGMNRSDQQARAEDDGEATAGDSAAAVANAGEGTAATDLGDEVMAILEAQAGIEGEA